jgi:hypothetical protein
MIGERTSAQEALFYGFSLEGHVPPDHMLRAIDRFVDLGDIRERLKPFYSDTGRPSIDPELMLRMLIVGYGVSVPLLPKVAVWKMAEYGELLLLSSVNIVLVQQVSQIGSFLRLWLRDRSMFERLNGRHKWRSGDNNIWGWNPFRCR